LLRTRSWSASGPPPPGLRLVYQPEQETQEEMSGFDLTLDNLDDVLRLGRADQLTVATGAGDGAVTARGASSHDDEQARPPGRVATRRRGPAERPHRRHGGPADHRRGAPPGDGHHGTGHPRPDVRSHVLDDGPGRRYPGNSVCRRRPVAQPAVKRCQTQRKSSWSARSRSPRCVFRRCRAAPHL